MKIGLFDVDSHHFPNLPLMKISAYHKAKGDSVEFVSYFSNYDIIYKSKVFTYSPEDNFKINSKKIIRGGTGYLNYETKLPENIEHICPDYSLYKIDDKAYGFLTRGCPNKCPWCLVPIKEGKIKSHADIEEFLDNRKIAILLDNNVLASSYGLKQIEKIIDLKIKVDFNQGLDARIIAQNSDIAKLLSRVKWLRYLRMSCDTQSQMKHIEKATLMLRKYGTGPDKRFFIYVLVKDDIEDALIRVNFLKGMDLKPFAQPYRDFENKVKVTDEQKEFSRWINVRNIFNKIDYENYKPRAPKREEKQLIPFKPNTVLPKDWNYDKSVARMKPIVVNWKTLTTDMLQELWIAREVLRNAGTRSDLVTKCYEVKTWQNYLDDIGLNRMTVHRWLAAYDLSNGKPERLSERSGGSGGSGNSNLNVEIDPIQLKDDIQYLKDNGNKNKLNVIKWIFKNDKSVVSFIEK